MGYVLERKFLWKLSNIQIYVINVRIKKNSLWCNSLTTCIFCVLQEKLSDAEDGLEAAARLHQQLDKCDQIIAALKEEGQSTVTL